MSLKKTENINENNMDPSECMNETDNRNICFLPDEHFFILDSEHLDRTETSFFGFCISDGILIDGNSNQKISAESLSGCGAYISITRSENEILIRQDYLGCYGLYLYQSSDGFVISNSFYYLLTYLKGRKLTINTDYVNAMQVVELCSMFYSETMIKEIEMLPSNVVLHIDIPKKELQTEILPHKEESVDLDSRPAFQILDSWFDRWTTFFRNLQKCTDNIQVALSGGFDSRVTFMLALCSGMDLNQVRINSIKDNLHTHEEDYLIAEKIAERKAAGVKIDETAETFKQAGYTAQQRFKGLGEMDAAQLWETTMNPENRTLVRVNIDDAEKADSIFSKLMGDQAELRKNFIQARAASVDLDDLDF